MRSQELNQNTINNPPVFISFEISNFQSIKDLIIKLSKGVTVITGTSDSGKSAIMRALRWFFFNSPGGFTFKSNFAKDKEATKVTANMSNYYEHIRITKYRDNKKHCYIMELTNEEGEIHREEFKAIGTKVPEEISKYFPVNGINFQTQIEQYFLLDQPASKVAKEFNKVANLEIMDEVMATINSMVRSSRQEITFIENDINEESSRYEELNWVDKASDSFNKILECRDEHEELSDYLDFVIDSKNEVIELDKKIKSYSSDFFGIKKSLEDLLNMEKYIEALNRHYDTIVELREDFEESDNALNIKSVVKGAKKAFPEIFKLKDDIDTLESRKKVIHRLLILNDMNLRAMKKAKKEYSGCVVNYESIKKELGVCPLCGSQL